MEVAQLRMMFADRIGTHRRQQQHDRWIIRYVNQIEQEHGMEYSAEFP